MLLFIILYLCSIIQINKHGLSLIKMNIKVHGNAVFRVRAIRVNVNTFSVKRVFEQVQ